MADAIAQKYNASKSQVLDHVSWVIDRLGWEITFLSASSCPGPSSVHERALCRLGDRFNFSVGSEPNNPFAAGRQSDTPSPPSHSAFLWLNFAFLHNQKLMGIYTLKFRSFLEMLFCLVKRSDSNSKALGGFRGAGAFDLQAFC